MSKPDLSAIVLAAGQGTRMRSATPKVLHRIAGRPLVAWSVRAALDAGASKVVVVVGHARERVESELRAIFGDRVAFAHQREQRGTGDAVACALAELDGVTGNVFVLNGDCPLLEAITLTQLETSARETRRPVALLTIELEEPRGYGRILRDEFGAVRGIREHKDASTTEQMITEVNSGTYLFDLEFVRRTIRDLSADNAAGELYLTDLVARAYGNGGSVGIVGDEEELRGVNDRAELAHCAAVRRRRIARALGRSGVQLEDPETTYVDAEVTVAADVTLHANVHLRGRTVVETGVTIDTGAVLTDVVVCEGAHVRPYTVAESSRIGPAAEVGPFSHLRTKTDLGPKAKVGNFTETKNTKLGKGSKVNHLAYVGDGLIGDDVNVGAGTIFCNYDGFVKSTTVLEDGVFIGSDSQLVAPVRVGKNAYVASGTTVTRDVPENALAISRTKQDNKEGLAEKLRARGRAAKAAKAAKTDGST